MRVLVGNGKDEKFFEFVSILEEFSLEAKDSISFDFFRIVCFFVFF